MRNRAPGNWRRISGTALRRTGSPLRGSSIRPRNTIVGDCPSPCHSGRGAAFAYRSTYTPLGMTTASVSKCSTIVRRASSETAILALIRSKPGRVKGSARVSTLDRSCAERSEERRVGKEGGGRGGQGQEVEKNEA